MIDCIQPSNPFPSLRSSGSSARSGDDSSGPAASFGSLLKAQESAQSGTDTANGSAAAQNTNSPSNHSLAGSPAGKAEGAAAQTDSTRKNSPDQPKSDASQPVAVNPAKKASRPKNGKVSLSEKPDLQSSQTLNSNPALPVNVVLQADAALPANPDLLASAVLVSGQSPAISMAVQTDSQPNADNNSARSANASQSVLSAATIGAAAGSPAVQTIVAQTLHSGTVSNNDLQTDFASAVDNKPGLPVGFQQAADPDAAGNAAIQAAIAQAVQNGPTKPTDPQPVVTSLPEDHLKNGQAVNSNNPPPTSNPVGSVSHTVGSAQLNDIDQIQPGLALNQVQSNSSKTGGNQAKTASDSKPTSPISVQVTAEQVVAAQPAPVGAAPAAKQVSNPVQATAGGTMPDGKQVSSSVQPTALGTMPDAKQVSSSVQPTAVGTMSDAKQVSSPPAQPENGQNFGSAQANSAGVTTVLTGKAEISNPVAGENAEGSAKTQVGNSVAEASQQASIMADASTNNSQAAVSQQFSQGEKLGQAVPSGSGSKTEDNVGKAASIKLGADKVQATALESVQAAPTVVKETGLGQPVVRATMAQADVQPQDLVQQIVSQMNGAIQHGQSSMRIQLHPQDLGTIDIQLVNSGHGISVTVSAEQASTGRLLQGQADQLRQSLQDSGIQLSNLNINQHGQPGQHGSASNQQHYAYPNGRGAQPTDLESMTNQEPQTGKINSKNLIEYLI